MEDEFGLPDELELGLPDELDLADEPELQEDLGPSVKELPAAAEAETPCTTGGPAPAEATKNATDAELEKAAFEKQANERGEQDRQKVTAMKEVAASEGQAKTASATAMEAGATPSIASKSLSVAAPATAGLAALLEVPSLNLGAKDKDQSATKVSPRLSPRPSATGASPRTGAEERRHSIRSHQAMQAHLFGGERPAPLEAKPRATKEERAEITARIQAPKQVRPVEKDAQCTFTPIISETSRAIAEEKRAQEDMPRWHVMASEHEEKKAKIEQMQADAVEAELSMCTFKPNIGGHERFSHVQAKFREGGYERYQNVKKFTKPTDANENDRNENDSKKSSPTSPRKPRVTPNSPGGLGSPGSRGLGSPGGQMPLNSYRGVEDPGQVRGEGVHVARARAAREEKAAREARYTKLGACDDSKWQSRRPTTTQSPFHSHTGLRRQQRKMVEEEKQMKTGEANTLFRELHEQLHSLELGGPRLNGHFVEG